MNYYFIRQRDQQYSNCLYLSKISKNYKLNDNYRSFTLPGQIEYTFSEDLYKQFKKEINTVKMTEFTALCLVGMLGCLAYIILNKLTK